jgi:hypothetical protein
VAWRDEPVTVGKANQINNFCIGAQGNERQVHDLPRRLRLGRRRSFDFGDPANVDCLACHADAAIYNKGDYGLPAEGGSTWRAAKSVRAPTRENCGKCHFDGGGGNGVKHGDLDESLYFPSENWMSTWANDDFLCTDCHTTEDHQVQGPAAGR